MEDNERERGRGLPADAVEARLDGLRRRGVLALTDSERASVLELVGDAARDDSGGDLQSYLLAWFTRREAGANTATAVSVRRAEAYVAYLLDVSADGEARAFEKLSGALGGFEEQTNHA